MAETFYNLFTHENQLIGSQEHKSNLLKLSDICSSP